MKTLLHTSNLVFPLPSRAIATKTSHVIPDVTVDLIHVTWLDIHRENDFVIEPAFTATCKQLAPTPNGLRLYYPDKLIEYSESFFVYTPHTAYGMQQLTTALDVTFTVDAPLVKTYTCCFHEPMTLEQFRFLHRHALITLTSYDGLQAIITYDRLPLVEDVFSVSDFYRQRWYDVHVLNDSHITWLLPLTVAPVGQILTTDVLLSHALHAYSFAAS